MNLRKKTALLLSASLLLSGVSPAVCLASVSDVAAETQEPEREEAWMLLTSEEWEVIRQTNRYRRRAGLEMLSMTEDTRSASGIRVQELAQSFGHKRPDGRAFGTVMGKNGSSVTGENIAGGFYTASDVMAAWKDSRDHKNNLLDFRYSHIGVRQNEGYWDQLFTICSGSLPEDVRLLTVQEPPVVAEETSLESLNYLICFTCSACGKTAYMPVIGEMCQGYDPGLVGDQTVTVACKGWSGTFPVTVRPRRLLETITLSEDSLTLKTGESRPLQASVDPTDADDAAVTWMSTNPDVALMTENGVTGFQEGTAEIYCVAADEGKRESDRCVVTVVRTDS